MWSRLGALALVVVTLVVHESLGHAQAAARQRVSIHRARSPRGGGAFSIVTVAPHDPDLVLVGTTNGIVMRSTDGGTTWDRVALAATEAPPIDMSPPDVDLSLPSPDRAEALDAVAALTRPNTDGLGVEDIAFCPSVGGAWTAFATTPGRIHRSRDLGASWEPLHAFGVDGGGLYVECDPARPSGIYVATDSGVAASPDDGESWSITPVVARLEARHVVPDPEHPDRIVAATPIGVYAGTLPADIDAAVYNDRLFGDASTDALYVALSGATLYAGMSDGAVVSHDGGRTWARVAETFLGRFQILMIQIDPRDPRHAYFLARDRPPELPQGPFDSATGRVFETRDGGETVTDVEVSATARVLEAITIDPVDPERLWLATDSALFVLEPPRAAQPLPRGALASRAALALRRDPGLAAVLDAALRRARLTADDEASLRSDLASAAWMPVVRLTVDGTLGDSERSISGRGTYRLQPGFLLRGNPRLTQFVWSGVLGSAALDYSEGGPPTRHDVATTGLAALVTFSWSLDRAVLDERQTSRAWLEARRVRRETQVVVSDAYVERRRLLVELATRAMPSARAERVALRVEELTALLDVLGAGVYRGSLGENARATRRSR